MADPRDLFRTGSSSLVPRADRRRQLVALGTISGLVFLAFGLWFVAILTSSDRDQLEIAEGPPPAAERPVAEEEEGDTSNDRAAGDEAAVEEPDREAPDVTAEERFGTGPDTVPEPEVNRDSETDLEADAETDPEADAEAETDPETDPDAEAETDPEADADAEAEAEGEGDPKTGASSEPDTEPEPDTGVERVTIDGVCTVELDASERDGAPLRAWEYADCAHAPVALDDAGEPWIVVRASMASGDFDAAGAQERARELGVDGGVLWSSHYPSLNPNFWVAYDGPFPDAEAARNAAESVGGDAYARALTD